MLGNEYFAQVISVDIPNATDENLTHLKVFGPVEGLQLWGSQVTNDGLRTIGQLHQLSGLNIGSPNVSDEGLDNLRGLGGLECLWLVNAKLGGPGLRHLADITGLKMLIIEDRYFTDENLQYLIDARQLESIQLHRTKVTEAGVRDLAEHLPACSICVSSRSSFAEGAYKLSYEPGEGVVRWTDDAQQWDSYGSWNLAN